MINIREVFCQCLFYTLGALADGMQVAALAGRADLVDRPLAAAVVAVQAVVVLVPREAGIATPALGDPVAAITHQRGCKAAPVQEQQYLSTGIKVCVYVLQ